jgi:hypothetical protein
VIRWGSSVVVRKRSNPVAMGGKLSFAATAKGPGCRGGSGPSSRVDLGRNEEPELTVTEHDQLLLMAVEAVRAQRSLQSPAVEGVYQDRVLTAFQVSYPPKIGQ